jgi:hypothetical protein
VRIHVTTLYQGSLMKFFLLFTYIRRYYTSRRQVTLMLRLLVVFTLLIGQYKKNGHVHNGKQNHHCHDCGRQFVQCFEQYLIAHEKRGLIERFSLRGICHAVGVTLKWLLGFLIQCFQALPDHLHVQPVARTQDVILQRLEMEANEMASFVQKKANKQWVWLVREVLSFSKKLANHIGAIKLFICHYNLTRAVV